MYEFKRWLYQNKSSASNAQINRIIEESEKYLNDAPYSQEILSESIREYLDENEGLKPSSIASLIERVKPYFSYRNQTGTVSLGAPPKEVVFYPAEGNLPRGISSGQLFNLIGKGNTMQVSIEYFESYLGRGSLDENLDKMFINIATIVPVTIVIGNKADRFRFLEQLLQEVKQIAESRELPQVDSEEAAVEYFKKNWNNIKNQIKRRIPVGKIPTARTLVDLEEIFKGRNKPFGDKNFGLIGEVLTDPNFAEQLNEQVNPDGKDDRTYGYWLFQLVMKKVGISAFSKKERATMEQFGEGQFRVQDPPEVVDIKPGTSGKTSQMPGRDAPTRAVFENEDGDIVYYFASSEDSPHYNQYRKTITNRMKEKGYKLIDTKTYEGNYQEYLDDLKVARLTEERLARKNRGQESVSMEQFFEDLENLEEMERRKEPRGERLRDRDKSGRAVSPSGRRFMPSEFYFHPSDINVELDPELFKMEISQLSPKERRRIKTFLQDAEPTKFFGEEYLKLGKVINTLGDIVDSSEEEELEGLDKENLILVKKLAHLRKRYENLYENIYTMVYGEEE